MFVIVFQEKACYKSLYSWILVFLNKWYNIAKVDWIEGKGRSSLLV